jgi:hypothetical protein
MLRSPARLVLHRKELTTEAVFAWVHTVEYDPLQHTCTSI